MTRYRDIAEGDADLAARLTLPGYPRSAAYNPRWVLENLMGPNVLWLTEALTQWMDLKPGMRVLDLGCGKAVSSIFLAREFGVQVWATDLWIDANANWERIRQTDVADRVFPLHAEAHDLPFADGFFDAAVSLDAYHYFGTDDLYAGVFARLVKEGGQLGIAVPSVHQELTDGVPEHLAPFWQPDFWSFHSPEWWRTHWQRSGALDVEKAAPITDGWKQWLLWQEISCEFGYVPESFQEWAVKEGEMLRSDAGRNLGFVRMVARRG